MSAKSLGVVVLNFGGPKTPDDVVPFLLELFNDPDVIKLPVGGPRLQSVFANRMSKTRSPRIVDQYKQIGGSPLVATTERQVAALKIALKERGHQPPIYVGMRYTEPSIKKMVEQIAHDKPERLVALALYPHYSNTTTGSSFNLFAQEMGRAGLKNLPVHYIPAFYNHPRYLAAMRARIEEKALDLSDKQAAHLLFSAHGLPSAYYKNGDPYPTQVQETVRAIVSGSIWPGTYSLAFQSKVGPMRWLEPSTEQEIHRLAEIGVKEALIVPISFVSDHIETLYEIDVTFGEFAQKHGVKLIRTAALDEQPDFIAALADVVVTAMKDEAHGNLGKYRCVRCLLPKPHEHRMKVQCMDCGFATPDYLLRLPPVKE